MSTIENLRQARNNKNDEYYTRYDDIQEEMNAYIEYNPDTFKDKVILCPCDDPEWSNFTRFFVKNFDAYGIKKLICTSYASNSKNQGLKDDEQIPYRLTPNELSRPNYDENFSKAHGKVFVLERDSCTFPVNESNLVWSYLEGDGDFRSDEVKALRDECDIIITNEPFSLFREFLKWILEAEKKFIIIINKNCITYKETFALIKENKIWVGSTPMSKDMLFGLDKASEERLLKTNKNGSGYKQVGDKIYGRAQAVWFTNVEHGKRHQKMELMTMQDNIRYNKKKKFIDEGYYKKYDNYDAINCPVTDAIPSDYDGVIGVPISFLDKYNPEQFEIVALGNSRENFTPNKDYINPKKHRKDGTVTSGGAINCVLALEQDNKPIDTVFYTSDNSKYLIPPYARILIKHKENKNED